ncbi:chromosome partitioning protein ParB [Acinetobacter sp. B10A]|uniref:chromosome partitioning protein ParB n=1 Tax=Acinetobacter baretiae TaxID=2605383 RepID=UPI001B3C886D|nr:chromosome partitioning protein ParB [Acinetobacter baretiae]MBF7686495.1 chromosome partitioning protein ParB [Acinetobacter baretiae]
MSNLKAGRPSRSVGAKEVQLQDIKDNTKKVRVNFDLEEDLHTELKMYALKNKKSVKKILVEQIKLLVK